MTDTFLPVRHQPTWLIARVGDGFHGVHGHLG
jgi:hypothetical protein